MEVRCLGIWKGLAIEKEGSGWDLVTGIHYGQ